MQVVSGQVIKDTYQVVRLAARGGMALLYEARHRELDLPVAVKVLIASQQTNPQHVRYFQNEAQALARLRHPGVPFIVDLGSLDGHPYLVMEWLEGETLSSRLRRIGRLELSTVLAICAQIAEVLTAAHELGIVHRDIKPDNIFLHQRPGLPEMVKVLDFGVARVPSLPKSGEEPRPATLPGILLGTPEYMAPEQARADPQAIGPHTDQYALAMLAYAMLSGQPAFIPRDNSLEALGRHLEAVKMLAPPTLGDHVGSEVQAVIYRALSKSPPDRYLSVQDFRAALVHAQHLDAHAPTRSGPHTAAEPRDRRERPAASVPPPPLPQPPSAHSSKNWLAQRYGWPGLSGLLVVALSAGTGGGYCMGRWRSPLPPAAGQQVAVLSDPDRKLSQRSEKSISAADQGIADLASSPPWLANRAESLDGGDVVETQDAATIAVPPAPTGTGLVTKPAKTPSAAPPRSPRLESAKLPQPAKEWRDKLIRIAQDTKLCPSDSRWRLAFKLVKTQLVVQHRPVSLSDSAEQLFSEQVVQQWLDGNQSLKSFPDDLILHCP